MALGKVHKLKPDRQRPPHDWRETFCGMIGRGSLVSSEYETTLGARFEATDGKEGVTCKRCRKGFWNRTDDPTGRGLGRMGVNQ